MSKTTFPPVVITMDEGTSQIVKIFPPPQVQQVPQVGTSMAGDNQTIEIQP